VAASTDGKTRIWVVEPSVKEERQHALHLVREVDIEPAKLKSQKPGNPDIRITAEELHRCSGNLEELRKIHTTQSRPQLSPMSESLGRLCRRPLMPKLRPSRGGHSKQDSVLFNDGRPRSWRHQGHSGTNQISKTSSGSGCSPMSSVGQLPPADRSWKEDFKSPASSVQSGLSLSRCASAGGGPRTRRLQNSGQRFETQLEREGLITPGSPAVSQLGLGATRPASSKHAQILCPLEGPRVTPHSRETHQQTDHGKKKTSAPWHHAM